MAIYYYPAYVDFAQDEKGNYVCMTLADIALNMEGETIEECFADAQNEVEEFLRDEKTLPQPSAFIDVQTSEDGQKSNAVLLVPIDTTFFYDPIKKKTLSARKSQWERIDKNAKNAGKTRSAYIVSCALAE